MKFSLAIVSLLAVVVSTMADTTPLSNYDNYYKQLADIVEQLTVKYQEVSGHKTEFDKEKFYNLLKTTTAKMTEDLKSFSEKLQKDSKALPEELKKKYDELVKQVNETVKGLNSPEVQAKYQKLQETFMTSTKKLGESLLELSKSVGLHPPPAMQKTVNDMFDEMQKSSQKMLEKMTKLVELAQEELKKKKP